MCRCWFEMFVGNSSHVPKKQNRYCYSDCVCTMWVEMVRSFAQSISAVINRQRSLFWSIPIFGYKMQIIWAVQPRRIFLVCWFFFSSLLFVCDDRARTHSIELWAAHRKCAYQTHVFFSFVCLFGRFQLTCQYANGIDNTIDITFKLYTVIKNINLSLYNFVLQCVHLL